MTRGELVAELAATLGARHEARFIVEDVLGPTPSDPDHRVDPADVDAARALAERRRRGEPLQYVLGHWSFRSLDLLVDPRVLIPRPETEQVVEVAQRELRRLGIAAPVLVDAGTGSGAIALSLATELARSHPGGRVWAIDRSADALGVAAANLERIERIERTRRHEQVGQPEGGLLPVVLVQGSWLNALPAHLRGAVTLVVANPPYVAGGEWPDLPADVRCEPSGALVAPDGSDGTPGLGDVEELLGQAGAWLARPGAVVIELAPHQAGAAEHMARAAGYGDVHVEVDLAGRPRALVAWVR
jgi:release factor glutamine methyltransferase